MTGSVEGKIEAAGPITNVKIMASSARVELLKARGLAYPEPVTVRALVDTGASSSAIDIHLVQEFGLVPTGSTLIHSPSGESRRDIYDISVAISPENNPRVYTIGVVATELARNGFFMLVGWDILSTCGLECDGPARKFTLRY